jgi:hypothetical protein
MLTMVDDFCTAHLPKEPLPGPRAVLSRREVRTWAICRQGLALTVSTAGIALRSTTSAFPSLPTRTRLHRPLRRHQPARAARPAAGAALLEADGLATRHVMKCVQTSGTSCGLSCRFSDSFPTLTRAMRGLPYLVRRREYP